MTDSTDPPLIFVIEDEDALRRDIVEELQESGYRAIEAANGEAALRKLSDATPDLVLCDISMPGLDGYGVLESLREMPPELATIPFVFLTALSEPQKVVEGKLLGADDYLVKPIDYDLMLATIGARLRQVERIREHHHDELATLRRALAGLSGKGAVQVLDLVALGVVLLDGAGRLLHANSAAYDLATTADCFRIQGEGVTPLDQVSGRAFRRAMYETLKAAKAGDDKVVGIQLHSVTGKGALSSLACALPAQENDPPDAPAMALFLAAPERRSRAPETLLMDLFGLTPTEARVAGALANGARTVNVAEELGVSQTTIAFHMRNLFQKTGTNRQADLVALILAGPMMIKSDAFT
ncbi:response regulator [Roseovarius sp. MMSF_3281]|uniref:response regulator n=1 Tax=Roseovarius sp. MMSF_3281 TaxID=3046694 RepID=UPI00273F1FA0|nr:response regulator [Roseovarius sp. MMSF_3281]